MISQSSIDFSVCKKKEKKHYGNVQKLPAVFSRHWASTPEGKRENADEEKSKDRQKTTSGNIWLNVT